MRKNSTFNPLKIERFAGLALALFLLVFSAQQAMAQADNCASAGAVTCGTSLTGQTNVGATNDAFPACNTNGTLATGAPNVWYTFVGTGQSVTVSTCANTSFDSEIGIFSGSCGNLVCVAGSDSDACGTSDETVTFNSVAGTNYFFMIQGHGSSTGTFTLDVTCAAPPADPCAAPIETIACASSKSVSLTGGGAGWNVTACGFSTPGAEKVYSFTATVTGTHTLQVTATNGTFIDYFFKAASGGCSSTGWTCIDDIASPSSVNFGPLTAGTTYLILLDDENTTNSTATFQINCPAPPVDPCAAPIETIACASSKTATLSGSGAGWSPNSCGFSTPGAEKVYSFTPTVTGNHTLQVTAADGTYIDYFFKDASGGCSSTGWTCIDDISVSSSVTFGPLTAGTTYYILLDDETTANTTHTFQINCPAPPDPCAAPIETIAACESAKTVTLSGAGGGWSPNSCGFSTPGAEKVYSFTPTVTGNHTLQVTATGGTFVDYFFKDASGGCSSTGWACIDDISSPTSASFGPLTAGTTYYILLDDENTTSSTHTFQINCPIPPVVLTCPTNTTAAACQTQASINAQFAAWLSVASGSGGCNGVLTNDNTGAPSACGGSTTVTFTYTSTCAPVTTTCQATFTVAAPPTVILTCPTNTTVAACQTQAAVNAQFATWLATATASGGCNGVLTDNNTGAPSACGGSTTVTFTYTSTCAPTTTTCQATFTVAAPPTVMLNCPNNTSIPANGDQPATNAAFAAWLATASASGGCNGVLTNNNTGAPDATNGGSTTVTFTYTSTCAPLTTTCQATFTVTNGPTVTLNCPNNTTAAACQTQAAINAQFAAWLASANASGGCNGVLTNNNTGAPPACGGSTTVTFTYTSTCAPLSTTCQATFTVAAPPTVVLTCPNNTTAASCQTQAAVNAQFATWLATATASGGCNGVLTNNNTGAPPACGGSTTVTFTYTSSCSPTTTTCQATFTVAAPPTVVLTCPTNTTVASCQTQAAVNTAFATWLATATASGGCNGVLTNNNTGAPSACGGSTTVTFTYTSSCAPLTTTCQATFTVAAGSTPVLTCPIPTTASACLTQAQLDAAYAAWLATATASGGCNGVISNNGGTAPSICSATAVTKTVTFTYTSSCTPTTTTCSSTFTVPAYPTFSLPANGTATVACPVNATQPTPPTVVDGCGKSLTPTGPTIVNNPNPLTCEGTRTYSWVYTDCAGHANTWSFVYTIERNPFSVPANGASTVACPSAIVQPVPPTVLSNCGEVLTPTGPVIVNNPNPITCEGTRTFTWTYTDCEGNTATWSHVTTVERQPFGVPANGGGTVSCPDLTDVQPVAPVVTSNCGEVLTPVVTSTAKPGCEGNRNWFFTYTDCEGNTATWTYIYTVEYQDFTVPASEVLTVNCPSAATEPIPPMVVDNCGKAVNMTGPVVNSTDNAQGCEASRSYTWTFQDCEGNTHTWGRTYNIQYTGDFFIYPDGEEQVACVIYGVPPFPPTVFDNCGQEVKVTGPTVSENISGCSGTRTYSYVYTSCTGASKTWKYTYHANDNEPPIGNCASGSLNSVDVTNLTCIADVPCPDSYDFSQKAQELLAAGGFYDVCSGADLVVEMDSWTDLWECSDPDGNGVNTFGRTFYFRIADQCGNEYPTLCGVTYSGVCTPIETFPVQAWGVSGGEPGTAEGTTDLAVISTLLNNNPLVVGGGNRSLTFTDANCVVALLPGLGTPTVLSNCHQTNCSGGCNPAGPEGMKNALAANTAALMLNMRYNVSYNALAMATVRNQPLGCIDISPNIKYCTGEPAVCKLRVFESNGTSHEFPYTIGGLVDLANLYLGGNLQLTATFSSLYATALNQSVASVNEYFHGDMALVAGCDPDAGVAPGEEQAGNKSLPTLKDGNGKDFSLSPNPAGSEVTVRLNGLAEAQDIVMVIHNSLGQQVLFKDFGRTAYLSERIDLHGIGSGLYFVTVKAGSERYEQKLVISKD